jgi:hypothetical protein
MTMPNSPGSGAPAAAPINLLPRQREVFDALAENSDGLANMYFGAMAVLQQTQNVDRVPLAAHGLRELMEKVPQYFDITVSQSTGASLGVKVNEIKITWTSAVKKSKCRADGKWLGQIDGHLRKFLRHAENFFEFHDQKFPKLVQKAREIVRHFDPLKGKLPEPLADLRASGWQQMDEYFKKVAHHRIVQSEREFVPWVEALELFLLDGLRPRTAGDQAALKKIIEEAEENAKS